MPILPLPQFEADLAADAEAYAKLTAPKSIVVRFGSMKMVGEYPSDTGIKPGCGSKLVARTHRGTEIVEMLTTTCPNSGCGKSVSRDQMLAYVENSGGKDYPFHTDGRILRVATVEDMNRQAALEGQAEQWLRMARAAAARVGLGHIKIVSAEPVLGGERITFHFLSEERIDFRPLVMELAKELHTRIEMHQVGARDEARIIADYERCGQHCCCKQFLKVLKPVSMKAAKTQKATLDPLKISGRCGRLMCCLRYEENTYDELKKNLPRKKTPILTPDGPGIVIDTQILTQLVLVRLDATNEDAAYPVETLKKIEGKPAQQNAGGAGDDDDETPETPGAERRSAERWAAPRAAA
ncbi:MAG: regulatory iron-sulfur-containing complex subunit RicT [Phycisphaerales bacterium]